MQQKDETKPFVITVPEIMTVDTMLIVNEMIKIHPGSRFILDFSETKKISSPVLDCVMEAMDDLRRYRCTLVVACRRQETDDLLRRVQVLFNSTLLHHVLPEPVALPAEVLAKT